jgi:Tfp pilus assembly protein PilX
MRRGNRGVALITVILVLFVLTILGITAAVMMTQEDRTSSRQDQMRSALYVAEMGLRRGEQVLGSYTYSNFNLATLIQHTAVAGQQWATSTTSLPIRPLADTSVPPVGKITTWDTGHLGTYLTTTIGGTEEVANVEITDQLTAAGHGSGQRAFYSVYVRNNPEDARGPNDNGDSRIRLISVGWLANGNGVPIAIKILEEEYNYTGFSQSVQAQKGGNPGGTGSGVYSGT